jgi:CheY-like chemotaxis protein
MDHRSQPKQGSVPTALIVEDNIACVYLWRRYTKETGFRSIDTSSGKEALGLARREQPALVVLDVTLPDIQGWEVLRALKADPITRDIPVLMSSGFCEEERSAIEGADAYLRKPVLYDRFVEVLARLEGNGRDA